MNKTEFLSELKRCLRKLPYEEVDNAISYYSEYFDDAGPENERRVIEELGSPSELAAKIMADYAIKDMEASPKSARKGISAIWFIILAIFASPIALPIALAFAIVAFALVVVGFALIFAFAVVTFALIGSGIFTTVIRFSTIFHHLPTAMFAIGSGLLLTAFGLLLSIPFVFLTKKSFGLIARLLNKLFAKRKVA